MAYEIFRFSVLRAAEKVDAPEPISLPAADVLKANGLVGIPVSDRIGMISEMLIDDRFSIAGTNLALSMFEGDSDRVEVVADGLDVDSDILVFEFRDRDGNIVKHPAIRPMGISDLYLIEQTPLRYEAGEISHVENVLASERRVRKHVFVNEREVRIEDETVVETASENSLATEERFELKASLEEVTKRDTEFSTSVEAKGKYGPTVEVAAKVGFSMRNAREKSAETASSYAKNVTEQAVTKTIEKQRSMRSERVLTRLEQSNTHEFDNTGSTQHIRGIYQYLDKVYQCDLVNHGPRFFFEFVVPSPGALLREYSRRQSATPVNKPKKPTTHLDDINPENFSSIVSRFGLTGVEPPPRSRVVASAEPIADKDDSKSGSRKVYLAGKIEVPQGLVATSAEFTIIAWRNASTDPRIDLHVGKASIIFSGGKVANLREGRDTPIETVTLEGIGDVGGEVSYSIRVEHDSEFIATIDLVCEPSEQAMQAWQLAVYSAIQQKYQDELAQWQAEQIDTAGLEFFDEEGATPSAELRMIEREELKRLCLQMLGQQATSLDPLAEGAIFETDKGDFPLEEGLHSLPRIQMDKLGNFTNEVLFAEQAFEWEALLFSLYPYYWHEQSEWRDMFKLHHDDPQHKRFLKAGAARVLVPIRQNFERRVHDFVALGVASLDYQTERKISSPDFVHVLEELIDADHQRSAKEGGDDVTDGPLYPFTVSTWETTLPTSLVILRTEDDLPSWEER
jgi:hypothetical protein